MIDGYNFPSRNSPSEHKSGTEKLSQKAHITHKQKFRDKIIKAWRGNKKLDESFKATLGLG